MFSENLNKIKVSINCSKNTSYHILTIQDDNTSIHKMIPMNMSVKKINKNYIILNEVNEAWNNTLTQINIIYQLPYKYW